MSILDYEYREGLTAQCLDCGWTGDIDEAIERFDENVFVCPLCGSSQLEPAE